MNETNLTQEDNKGIDNLFRGRITRKHYILGLLLLALVAVIPLLILFGGDEGLRVFAYIILAVRLFFGFSLHIRRLHDIGKSGWMVLLTLIPIVNLILIAVLLFSKGKDETNQYGNRPPLNANLFDVLFGKYAPLDDETKIKHEVIEPVVAHESSLETAMSQSNMQKMTDAKNEKNIFSRLLVRRSETNGKWWHRLVLVLIYGSTIIIAIGALIVPAVMEDDFYAGFSEPVLQAHNFQEKYTETSGEELRCEPMKYAILFECGSYSDRTIVSLNEFLEENVEFPGLYDEYWDKWREAGDKLADKYLAEEIFLEDNKINLSEFDFRIKIVHLPKSGDIFMALCLYLIIVFGWIIIWESIIYRTILFIAYGRAHKKA